MGELRPACARGDFQLSYTVRILCEPHSRNVVLACDTARVSPIRFLKLNMAYPAKPEMKDAVDRKYPVASEGPVSPDENSLEERKRSSRRLWLLFGVGTIVVMLGFALGLGLGLGLKHVHNSSKSGGGAISQPSGAPTTPSQASLAIPPWRSNVEDYTLHIKSWDFNAPPTTREYNLTLSEVQLSPDGVTRTMIVINGGFPGPVIRANMGDRLLIHVQNNLPNGTAIHWHGLYQNGTNWMDGTSSITQCPIPPRRSFTYNFTLENQFGTYWYHTHYSSTNGDGPVGPLIIHSPQEVQMQKDYDVDQIVLMQDWYHDYSPGLLPGYLASGSENGEPVPDNGLIQGTNFFNCSSLNADSGYACHQNSTRAVLTLEQGKRYRYRLINTGAFATFEFSIDNHPLTVIEADGTATEELSVHRLDIAVAQRYSVIINANQSANSNYWMRAQMNTFCFGSDNPVLDADVKALITYKNNTADPTESVDWKDALDDLCVGLNSSLLTPLFASDAPAPTTMFSVAANFQIGAYALDRAYINGTSWTPAEVPTLNQAVAGLQASNFTFTTSGVSSAFSANQYIIDIPDYAVVDLLISNYDEGAHPFHLHGHTFWVIASSPDQYFDWSTYSNYNQTLSNVMRRDTVMIDAYGWAMIRFKADNPGLWALHCHITWHMESGLLMQFQTRNDIMRTWTLPEDVLGLCNV
jgi:FtsP/CotA-like multicopper oxidase with cupredoxin domain